jgi:prepilin-type N-terminal cleavage/methylation domain-containing protein
MSRGTTLLEILLVLTIGAVVAAFAVPAIGSLRDQLLVDEEASRVASAHARARLVASVERRVTVLTLTADSLVLRAVEGPADTTERWRAAGPAGSGVNVTGFPRSVTFAPTGIAFGFANGTYGFTRGSARKQVIVSRYGRVRQQ